RAAQFRHPAENAGALPPEPPAGVQPVIKVNDSHASLVHGELTVTVGVNLDPPYPEPLLTFSRTSTGGGGDRERRGGWDGAGVRGLCGDCADQGLDRVCARPPARRSSA